jgi:hypothetical protein
MIFLMVFSFMSVFPSLHRHVGAGPPFSTRRPEVSTHANTASRPVVEPDGHQSDTNRTPDAGGGFQVQVFVNGAEMTSAWAGLGMDPYDLLVPSNRLVATVEPRTAGIARCSCGVYGCGSTDVTIVVSRWDEAGRVDADLCAAREVS